MNRMRFTAFVPILAAVILLAAGTVWAQETQERIVTDVQVILSPVSAEESSVEITLNPEFIASESDIYAATIEDALGNQYDFSPDEFIMGASDNYLVKVFPFRLPDGNLIVTVTDMQANTHTVIVNRTGPRSAGGFTATPAATSYNGSWSGKGERYDVTFTVSNNRVTRFDITFEFSCNGGGFFYSVMFSDWNSNAISGGQFSISDANNTFTGTFSSSSACTGTFATTMVCGGSGNWAASNSSAPAPDPDPDPVDPDPDPTDPWPIPGPGSKTVYIPHITGGAGAQWKDYLQIDNFGNTENWFSLALYSGPGTLVYGASYAVQPMGRRIISLKDAGVAPTADCGVITYSTSDLKFRLTQEINTRGIAEFQLTNTLAKSLAFLFTDVTSQFSSIAKGIALSNFGDTDAVVTLSAIGGASSTGAGSVLRTATVTVKPNQRLLGVHTTWFPGLPISSVRSIRATTTSSVLSGVAISANAGNTQLLFTPAIVLEQGSDSLWPTN